MAAGTIDLDESALVGADLGAEIQRTTRLNKKVSAAIGLKIVAAVMLTGLVIFNVFTHPDPIRVPVDAYARAYPADGLAGNDPPDAKITQYVGDCMLGIFNGAFHNFESVVARKVGECFVGDGTSAVMREIAPFMETMKTTKTNLASQFITLPLVDQRTGANPRTRVYKVKGVIAIGFRGEASSSRAVSYAFEADVARVGYESSLAGMRIRNLIMKEQGGN